jgi:hypothetical protein
MGGEDRTRGPTSCSWNTTISQAWSDHPNFLGVELKIHGGNGHNRKSDPLKLAMRLTTTDLR